MHSNFNDVNLASFDTIKDISNVFEDHPSVVSCYIDELFGKVDTATGKSTNECKRYTDLADMSVTWSAGPGIDSGIDPAWIISKTNDDCNLALCLRE